MRPMSPIRPIVRCTLNSGFFRAFVACSNAYANLSSAGSLHAPAKNEIPTGSPNAEPAGTVMCG